MKEFQVILSPSAERDILKLPKEIIRRTIQQMEILKHSPFPQGDKIKKIRTTKDDYRLRIGNYRIIYRVKSLKIIVLKIIDKKDFQKALKDLN